MNIGKAIKDLRLEKKLNQSAFAEKVELTQTALSQIESGSKRPNPSTMKKICDFFGMSEAALYLIATEDTDIPEHKRKLYETLFLNLKKTMIDMLIN